MDKSMSLRFICDMPGHSHSRSTVLHSAKLQPSRFMTINIDLLSAHVRRTTHMQQPHLPLIRLVRKQK
jgi:hypothetical protein